MPTLPNSTLSRAILLGTSQFRGSADLQDLPAVRRNLTDLRTSLTNAEHGVLTGDNMSRDARVWVRVIVLRLLWVGLGVMVAMGVSSLLGVSSLTREYRRTPPSR